MEGVCFFDGNDGGGGGGDDTEFKRGVEVGASAGAGMKVLMMKMVMRRGRRVKGI